MTGRRPGFYWRVTWKAISPLLLLTIFVAYFALLAQTPLNYRAWNPQYVGPSGAPRGPGTTGGVAGLGAIQGPNGTHGAHLYRKRPYGCLCYAT